MAVVTVYGTGYKDPASLATVDATLGEGRVVSLNSKATVTNGDSAASVYYLGRVPSNAIILPGSRLDNGAVTGASASLGFKTATAALIPASSIATAGTIGMTALTPATLNNRAWQLAGFSSDPGGMLDVILTLTVAATATAAVNCCLIYARK
jgi:hypothetical protein